ncbi:MAG: tryptophan synthase subunit beta [Candidatus Limnocylindria bacterium]
MLDELLTAARARSRAEAHLVPLRELRDEVCRLPAARRFEATLRTAPTVSIIAEAKRSSPSSGRFDGLADGTDAVRSLAATYSAAGARALSILTEPTRFGGSDDDLMAASRVGLPVLRKDFIVDAHGVWRSRSLGADAVLLIARALPGARLAELIEEAGSAGIDALVEVHDRAELNRALAADATLIGVNARNLATLEVDLRATLPILRAAADAGATVVAESGISGADDLRRVADAGAAAVLVGTSLLRSADPAASARRLVRAAPSRAASLSMPFPRRTTVKACGQRDAVGLRAVSDADADMVGFVVDPRSPRAVEPSRVRELLDDEPVPRPVLVFRAPTRATVAKAMRESSVDAVQIAGFDAPPSWLSDLDPHPSTVIGVLHAPGNVREARQAAEAWVTAGATHLLLEGASASAGGGAGGGAPVAIARRLNRLLPAGIAGGLDPSNVARAVRDARPAFVDASSGLARAGHSDPRRIRAYVRAARRDPSGADRVDANGRFGRFGGRYVPETLIPALDELTAAWNAARRDPEYRHELEGLHRDVIGRPTPLFAIPTAVLGERGARGASVWLKREDLAHTGAHKINNAIGQAVLARRMGKRRVIAETGAGQHGVATATACALLGLECVVYMGATDIERQAPNVARMNLLGAEVRPVNAGNGTLRDALNEALRDWVANVETTFYILGSAAGPHPYPEMVASLQSVIGQESRAQLRERIGRVPDLVVACVGGGSNAIGIMRPFLDTRARLFGVEAGGRGDALGDNAASLGLGTPGILHGAFSMLTQDAGGQVSEPHSISAGLDYPGVGPQLAALAEAGRMDVLRATDAEALEATLWLARSCGIIPALESAHALAAVLRMLPELDADAHVLVNLSGRGDKDLAILEREGLGQ